MVNVTVQTLGTTRNHFKYGKISYKKHQNIEQVGGKLSTLRNKSPERAQSWQPTEIGGDEDSQQLADHNPRLCGPALKHHSIWKIPVFCIPSPLDTIQRTLSLESWIMTNESRPARARMARMARMARSPTTAEKRTTKSPEDSAQTEGWGRTPELWVSKVVYPQINWLICLMGWLNQHQANGLQLRFP